MLNLFEGFDLRAMGFGTPDTVHLWAEVTKLAFADRTEYVADPSSTAVPVEWLTSKEYAEERRPELDLKRSQQFASGVAPASLVESTTHCTAIDSDGNIVSTTNTLHMGFGSKVTVPGTGMLLNDCMELMDPNPGRTNSIAPRKRVLSSMSPVIVLKDGAPFMTLGCPGGLKIFGAVAQAISNVIDHEMSLQAAFEAPRMWGRGPVLEVERGFSRPRNRNAPESCRRHERLHASPGRPARGSGVLARGRCADGLLRRRRNRRRLGTRNVAFVGGLGRQHYDGRGSGCEADCQREAGNGPPYETTVALYTRPAFVGT
jgi:gamma-glutamyltranspeptidase/glutathione hydrolase